MDKDTAARLRDRLAEILGEIVREANQYDSQFDRKIRDLATEGLVTLNLLRGLVDE